MGHKRVGSTTDVELDDMDKHDTESSNSQQGIIRTIKVSMEWERDSCAGVTNDRVSEEPSRPRPYDWE
jgi:hypothetical protein